MPTGYTGDIYDGKDVSFEDFVWTCARAFGALVTMRDEPTGAPIPEEFKPSDYHVKGLKEAQARLADVEAWDYSRADAEARSNHRADVERYEKWVLENQRRRQDYGLMLIQVKDWTPPTPDHDGLKELMAEQLEKSIEFDCGDPHRPTMLHGSTYHRQEADKARRDIEYHTEHHTKEVQRANERTQWVRALRDSFNDAVLEVGDDN